MKIIPIVVLFFLVSCSWVDKTKRKLLGQESVEQKRQKKFVSKSQYDELLRRYDRMKNKYEGSGEEAVVKNDNVSGKLLEDLNDLAPSIAANKAANDSIETVDVFGDNGIAKSKNVKVPTKITNNSIKALSAKKNASKAAPIFIDSKLSLSETNKEVGKYQQGLLYIKQKKKDLALRVFQELEHSPLAQIRVRAKFNIGNLLLLEKEYDLALQVYEDIVENYAFSGVIIQTLKRMIICCDRLNLSRKKEKYDSLVHDIFGA